MPQQKGKKHHAQNSSKYTFGGTSSEIHNVDITTWLSKRLPTRYNPPAAPQQQHSMHKQFSSHFLPLSPLQGMRHHIRKIHPMKAITAFMLWLISLTRTHTFEYVQCSNHIHHGAFNGIHTTYRHLNTSCIISP